MPNKTLHKRIRDDLFYLLILFQVKLLRLLPRTIAMGIMRTMGRLLFCTARRAKKRTIKHLTMAFGDEKTPEEIQNLARGVFLHFTSALADIIRMPNLLKSGLDELITAEGIENLDAALSGGKGAMMITAHFGNWELLGAWLAKNGYPMSVVGTSLYDPRLDKIIVETRKLAGNNFIARGKDTREIIRWLKKGKLIGMLIDQDTKVRGVFVDFFGKPTYTPTGAAELARKFKLPIVPIFMRMNDDFTYHIECGKALHQNYSDDPEQDIIDITQKCSDTYEEIIRRHPTQWVWMHQRWKTTPENPIP
ncbi:MAG: lysophospholipid acyltransferase family protein [Proteobacteria bacterium]|nr:lysophospholipid acyltransferase family protein [Pseudomonadota bacterium]MBU1708816.1 lysophospholipid acyltransferase family protein [Pseudomonadota bacterium]